MNMVSQTKRINIVPGIDAVPVFHIAKGDKSARMFILKLMNGEGPYALYDATGITATIQGVLPDGTAVTSAATIIPYAVGDTNDSTEVRFGPGQQFSPQAGRVVCRVVLTATEQILGSGKFFIDVDDLKED